MNNKCFIFFLILVIPFYSFAQNKNLDYYISNAISNSPLLNDYRNQILSNRIDSQILRASYGVQINGNGNSYYAPVRDGYGYDAAITNGKQLQALMTATKNLLPKKYLNLQFRDLQFISDSLRNASKITEQDIKRAIINQYIITYGDQLQMDFNNRLYTLLNREEIILKKLTQANIYRQVDYLSFLVTYQQQNLTRQQLAVQYNYDYATLNYLAGIIDTTVSTLAAPDINIASMYYPDSSVFFLKYKIDSLKLINNKALIDINYRPHFSVYADAGVQSTFAAPLYKNFGTSFGVSFIVPIYNGGQKRMQYSKIDILERTRIRNREFFQAQYYQQIAQLRQQLYAIENLIGAINKQIKYIETLIEVNGKLLQTGDIKMTDYILAVNNYIVAQNLVVQNMISRYQVINQLNYWNK